MALAVYIILPVYLELTMICKVQFDLIPLIKQQSCTSRQTYTVFRTFKKARLQYSRETFLTPEMDNGSRLEFDQSQWFALQYIMRGE